MVFVDGGSTSIRDFRRALRLPREGGGGDTIELYRKLVVDGLVMRQSLYGVVLVAPRPYARQWAPVCLL